MEITLYLKLEGYDDGDFDVSNNYYKSDESFSMLWIEKIKSTLM